MDQLRAITYFLTVARFRSITAAAHEFDVSAPAVSQLISALERELGVTLLRRTSRHVSLTADGEIFLPACETAVAQLRGAVQRLASNQTRPAGKLVLGMARIVGEYVAPFLADFLAQHPDLTLDVRLVQKPEAPLAASVDVLAIVGWPKDTDMSALRIAQTRLLTCASPGYWQAHGIPTDPDELRKHSCLAFRTPWDVVLDLWKYRRGNEERSVTIEPRMVSDDREYNLAAAFRGAGIVRVVNVIPRNVFDERLLVPVLQDWEALEAPPIYLLYRRRPAARVRVLITFLADLFAKLQATPPGSAPTALEPVPMPAHFRRNWAGPLSLHARTQKRGRRPRLA